jgi:VWFA-related protein
VIHTPNPCRFAAAFVTLLCAMAGLSAGAPADVALTLVAVDRAGQAVDDLKSEEVQVFDNGKAQKIASFHRQEKTGSQPLVILLDLLNTGISVRGPVRDQIVQAMEHLALRDSIYLYILSTDGSVHPVRALPETGAAAQPDASMALDEALRNAQVYRPAQLDDVTSRVRATYEGLKFFYAPLAVFPGRKNIVWISRGVLTHGYGPGGQVLDYTPTLKKIAAAFGDGNIAIYAVGQSTEAGLTNRTESGLDTLKQFASISGGRVYPTDNVERAIAEAMRDTASSYALEYRMPADGQDRGYHTIRLNCTRPGIRVSTRQGYFANPPVSALK